MGRYTHWGRRVMTIAALALVAAARAHAYVEAGANMIFAEALRRLDAETLFSRELPCLTNGKT